MNPAKLVLFLAILNLTFLGSEVVFNILGVALFWN